MKRLAAILLCLSLPVFGQAKGEVDWGRRVLVAHGRGAPDLNAPSIAVARLAAERAAKADGHRNALEALKALPVQPGGTVGSLLQNDPSLGARIDAQLNALKPVKSRYYSDGGIELVVEVPLDDLPPPIAQALRNRDRK